jgi:hypothetical protein
MKKTQLLIGMLGAMILLTATIIFPGKSFAHCDTLDGPVVATARAALDKGDVAPLLKWVRKDDEKEKWL